MQLPPNRQNYASEHSPAKRSKLISLEPEPEEKNTSKRLIRSSERKSASNESALSTNRLKNKGLLQMKSTIQMPDREMTSPASSRKIDKVSSVSSKGNKPVIVIDVTLGPSSV